MLDRLLFVAGKLDCIDSLGADFVAQDQTAQGWYRRKAGVERGMLRESGYDGGGGDEMGALVGRGRQCESWHRDENDLDCGVCR